MGWHYKSPKTFSARFPASMLEAAASAPEPILFSAYHTESQAQSAALTHRWFRWCIRQRPEADKSLFHLLETYSFRTQVKTSLGTYSLYLTAKPNAFSDLLTADPSLTDFL